MILVRNSGSWTEFLSLLLSGFLQVDHFLTLKPAPIYFRMKTLMENRGNDSCSLLDPPTDIWVDPVFPTAVSAQSAHRTRRGKSVSCGVCSDFCSIHWLVVSNSKNCCQYPSRIFHPSIVIRIDQEYPIHHDSSHFHFPIFSMVDFPCHFPIMIPPYIFWEVPRWPWPHPHLPKGL